MKLIGSLANVQGIHLEAFVSNAQMEKVLENARGRIRDNACFWAALDPDLFGEVFGMASYSTENSEEPMLSGEQLSG